MHPSPPDVLPRRLGARYLLLALVLAMTAVGGIQLVHGSPASGEQPVPAFVAGQSANAHGHDLGSAEYAAVGSPAVRVWLRDGSLAVPVVLAGLLLGAALTRGVRAARGRWSIEGDLVGRAVATSAALAIASPGHGLLFDESEVDLASVVSVFLLCMPITLGVLMMVAAATMAASAVRGAGRQELPGRRPADTPVGLGGWTGVGKSGWGDLDLPRSTAQPG